MAHDLYNEAIGLDQTHAQESKDLHVQAAALLVGQTEEEPVSLRIDALYRVADLERRLGNDGASRKVAEEIVATYFDNHPDDAVEVLVAATLLLAKLYDKSGDSDEALALLDRLLVTYGRPSIAGHALTAALANGNAGWTLGHTGQVDEAIVRYRTAIDWLQHASPPEPEREAAVMRARLAYFLHEAGRHEEANQMCDEIIRTYANTEDPEVAGQVESAHEMLAYWKPRRRKRPW